MKLVPNNVVDRWSSPENPPRTRSRSVSVDHRRERPIWFDRPHRRAPERFVPSVSAPSPKLSRSCQQSLSEQCRFCGEATPLSCQLLMGTQGKGQSKTSKEQHTGRRGINPPQPTRWKRDRAACQSTTL